VIIDAVRCAKLALDRGIGGPLIGPSSYFMKSPPVQFTDEEAHQMVEAFIAGKPADIEAQQRHQQAIQIVDARETQPTV
jgi:myo-inositol-1-phosphate synthase